MLLKQKDMKERGWGREENHIIIRDQIQPFPPGSKRGGEN